MSRRRFPIAWMSVPIEAITSTRPKPAWIDRRMCPFRMAQVTLWATPLKYSGGLEPGWLVGILTSRLTAMPSRNWPISISSATRNEIRSCRVVAIAGSSLFSPTNQRLRREFAGTPIVIDVTVFEAVGGAATFRTLVERFYARVATDPILRPIYPDDDLSSATERLTLFLIQYWGGPDTYSATRGHPRLRLRHQPFAIGQAERDAWLRQMTAAVESLDLPPDVRKELLDYFDTASTAMINRPV